MVTPNPSDSPVTDASLATPKRRSSDALISAPPNPYATGIAGVLRWFLAGMMALACALSLILAWRAQSQVRVVEQELVRRQDISQLYASEAQAAAKAAQEAVRDSAAKIALIEAKVTEISVQRGQLEEIVQSLTRSRDDNVVGDLEAAIRVALQQTAITGSAEPLVAALKQADELLERHNQPRLQGIRRAIQRDLDRIRAVGVSDIGVLTLRLDEAVRLIDELPLVSASRAQSDIVPDASLIVPAEAAAPMPSAAASDAGLFAWWSLADNLAQRIWTEARSLIRVSRIEQADAVLLAPDQAFFLRENLKLRLLNARLALLSRQFDTAQADLKVAQEAIQRYFNTQSRRTQHAAEVVRQVNAQAKAVMVPRPDDTFAALAAVESRH